MLTVGSVMVPTAEFAASVCVVSVINASLVGKAEFRCRFFNPNGFFCRFALSSLISLIDLSIDEFSGFACPIAAFTNFHLLLLLRDSILLKIYLV